MLNSEMLTEEDKRKLAQDSLLRKFRSYDDKRTKYVHELEDKYNKVVEENNILTTKVQELEDIINVNIYSPEGVKEAVIEVLRDKVKNQKNEIVRLAQRVEELKGNIVSPEIKKEQAYKKMESTVESWKKQVQTYRKLYENAHKTISKLITPHINLNAEELLNFLIDKNNKIIEAL